MLAPARIETERLVIRCWQPEDAAGLKQVIDRNLDHLRPWMPWVAHEPEPLQQKTERLREFRAMFERDEDLIYAIFDSADSEVLGGTGLHPRAGPEAREVGYLDGKQRTRGQGPDHRKHRGTHPSRFELLALDRIEIHCDPRNVRSAAVPERLGYERERPSGAVWPTPTGRFTMS